MKCLPSSFIIRSGTPPDNGLLVRVSYRIREIMAILGMNQVQFADFMGAKSSEVSKWLSGEHNFTLKTLASIETKTGHKICYIPSKKL